MKKIVIRTLCVVVLFIMASCLNDLTSINQSPKAYSSVPGDTFFSNAARNLTDGIAYGMTFKILAQQFAETTYFDASSYNLVNVGNGFWVTLYRDVLRDLKEAKKVIAADETIYQGSVENSKKIKQNKLAIAEILEIYTYSLLVTTYGNVPYSSAVNTALKSEALSSDDITPAYDDAAAIFGDLFVRLDKAIPMIVDLPASAEYSAFGSGDLINEDDLNKWRKFGYSLKLRMAMTLADVNPTLAKSMAEAAATKPLISSNSDNSSLEYLSTPPNTNPIWTNIIQSGREDYVASNTMLDLMKAIAPQTNPAETKLPNEDPRLPLFYTKDKNGGYSAGTYGRSNAYVNFSHFGELMTAETFSGVLLDYSEVEFYLAEAVARGYNVGGTVESHYNNAIAASIDFWGGSAQSAATYLALPGVAFSTAVVPGTGLTGALQKIAKQKYLAMFNRGYEAWTEYRRFDYPVFNKPPVPNGDFPIRYTYPNSEQTGNGENYTLAAAAIGGDKVTTRVFWDVK